MIEADIGFTAELLSPERMEEMRRRLDEVRRLPPSSVVQTGPGEFCTVEYFLRHIGEKVQE